MRSPARASIHQNGMLKVARLTYEITLFGGRRRAPDRTSSWENTFGTLIRYAACDEMGYTLTCFQLETLFHDFKALADKKKEVYDEDLTVCNRKCFLEDVPSA